MTLKEEILSKGLKQIWIAEKLGIPLATLNAYLNGYRNIPKEITEDILKIIRQ